nr:EthD domain-containing protein [Sphingobium sp. Sx8-8]
MTDVQAEGRLAEKLQTETDRLAAEFPHKLDQSWAFRVRDPELEAAAAGAFHYGVPFDAILEIFREDGGDLSGLVPLLGGFAERLGDTIRPAASAALVATEHVIMPGFGSLLIVIANRRLPKFDHEEFVKYWHGHHGPFAESIQPEGLGFGYRQAHADMALSAQFAREAGLGISDFDGAAETYWIDADRLRNLMGTKELVDQTTADERNFVDHARCVTSLFDIASWSTR